MLVPLFPAIPREMLQARHYAVFHTPLIICLHAVADKLRVTAVGPRINQTVSPVAIDVPNRTKRPVIPHCRCLTACNPPHLIGITGVSRRPDLRPGSHQGSPFQRAVRTGLTVSRVEIRNFCTLLKLCHDILSLLVAIECGPERNGCKRILFQKLNQLLPAFSHERVCKELAYLFMRRHGGLGFLYPPLPYFIQIKRISP